MQYKYILSAALAMAVGSAQAVPLTLADVTGVAAFSAFTNNDNLQAAELTDTDGTRDNATAFLFLESAGFANDNSFGIYGYSVAADGTVTLGNTLQVFSGAAAPGTFAVTSTNLAFNLTAGTVTGAYGTANIGRDFGFYLAGPGGTFYSHTALNRDGVDHAAMFDTTGANNLGGADLVIGWEDLAGGGDRDYNDMVVGISDVVGVPEPGTLALMGLGLLAAGAAGFRNRKKHA